MSKTEKILLDFQIIEILNSVNSLRFEDNKEKLKKMWLECISLFDNSTKKSHPSYFSLNKYFNNLNYINKDDVFSFMKLCLETIKSIAENDVEQP
jgi:hypothetical protein